MAAAVTLTMTAAIIYGSGHYPNDGSGLIYGSGVGFAEFLT